MPLRLIDRNRWEADLKAAGVDIESLEVAEHPKKLTIFLFFRMHQLCKSTAHFRDVLLRFLGFNPLTAPSRVISIDKLRIVSSKIALSRKCKRGEQLEVFEKSEFDLNKIGFYLFDEPPQANNTYSSPFVFGEPLPKISRITEDSPFIPAALGFKSRERSDAKRSEYWRKKYQEAKANLSEFQKVKQTNVELYAKIDNLTTEVNKLKRQLNLLENELEHDHASALSGAAGDRRTVKLKNENGAYSPEALMLFAQLSIEFQVAESKIGFLLGCIIHFLGFDVDSLPSARTIGRSIHVAAAAMAHQVYHVLRQPDVEFTLLSDETTKKTNKLQAFVLTYHNNETQEIDRLYLEIEAVPNKESQRQFQALIDAVESITFKAQKCQSTVLQNFMLQVKHLMGDQARTQIKFADLFNKYREIVVRDVTPNFDALSEEEQQLLLQTNLLFCFLHITSNSTPQVLKVLHEDEKKQTGKPGGAKSTVEVLLIELGRYFGPRAAAHYPTVGLWKLYCEKHNIQFGNIDSYSKSRFHMLFIISVEVLLNKDHIIAFIEDHFEDGGVRDFLLEGLRNELIISHIMVLAAYEVNVLGPLWRLAERSPNPAESHNWIDSILSFFGNVQTNPMLIFSDNSPLEKFEGAKTNKPASIAHRAMLEGLEPPTGSSRLSVAVAEVLESYFEKQFSQQLSPEWLDLGEKLRGVPLTNAACESVFSTVDRSYQLRPNMKVHKRATHAAVTMNRTFRYLMSLSEEERQEIYKICASHRSAIEKFERLKSAKYSKELVQQMEKKELQRARNRQSILAKKQKLREDLDKIGYWESVEALEEAVALLKPSKAIQAVKQNIRFRKLHNTGKVSDGTLFRFQVKGHKFCLAELIDNLSQLINMDKIENNNSIDYDSDDVSDFDEEE